MNNAAAAIVGVAGMVLVGFAVWTTHNPNCLFALILVLFTAGQLRDK